MKKLILSLISATIACTTFAQSCVTIQQVSTNYATNQVTFDLKWGTCNNTNHLYRVWVFVDYRPVTITTKGAWGRAIIAATDKGTLVSANNGVWVTGTANTTQRVTLTLNVVGNKFDWCAFAIDYPPNATRNNGNGTYTLRGTPPFTVNGVQLGDTQNTYSGNCITAITDATNNPDGFATGNYTTNDGACKSCGVAYVQLRNHCGVVTNSQYNTYSNESCTAGCAPEGSTNWTDCNGFSYITSDQYEGSGRMNFSTADSHCKSKGMRLPTRTELSCMCSNNASLPGGYYSYYYWSSTVRSDSGCYVVGFGSNLSCYVNVYYDGYSSYVKCVK